MGKRKKGKKGKKETGMSKKNLCKPILYIIIALSLLGLLTSLYLVNDHYSHANSACDINDVVSCSLVNSSIYSELFGIPVAIFGAIWFVILIGLTLHSLKNHLILQGLVFWNVLGVLFVLYMIYAEFMLRAICPFCTIVHIVVIINLFLSIFLLKKIKPKKVTLSQIWKVYKVWIIMAIILNILPFIILNLPQSEKPNYDSDAKCITEKGVNMYGSFKCGVCAKTRKMFGDSFQYINEIECHPQGEDSQWELCQKIGLKGTPTWILEPDGKEMKRHTGFLDVEELKEFAGCE